MFYVYFIYYFYCIFFTSIHIYHILCCPAAAYHQGNGVPLDMEKCVKYTKLAADQGHVNAQYNLGVLYEHGEGTEKNIDEAVKLYTAAAAQMHAPAMCNLGTYLMCVRLYDCFLLLIYFFFHISV